MNGERVTKPPFLEISKHEYETNELLEDFLNETRQKRFSDDAPIGDTTGQKKASKALSRSALAKGAVGLAEIVTGSTSGVEAVAYDGFSNFIDAVTAYGSRSVVANKMRNPQRIKHMRRAIDIASVAVTTAIGTYETSRSFNSSDVPNLLSVAVSGASFALNCIVAVMNRRNKGREDVVGDGWMMSVLDVVGSGVVAIGTLVGYLTKSPGLDAWLTMADMAAQWTANFLAFRQSGKGNTGKLINNPVPPNYRLC